MNVFLMASLTADGFIAEHSDHFADWTSSEDKKLFRSMTTEAGTMVMGARTFDTIGKALPNRQTIVYTSKPDKYQLENVSTTSETPAELVERLSSKGQKALAICGGATIYRLFLAAGVVDDIYLTVEPVLFGQGISLLDQALPIQMELVESKLLNTSSMLLHYKVVK